jgi:hypothetical protein
MNYPAVSCEVVVEYGASRNLLVDILNVSMLKYQSR